MAGRERLESYRGKRDFSRTPEPAPGPPDETRARGRGRLFTIQKHAARRLHFDLRLEHDGVLLSWAVTKGPSLDPSEKRLAVRTEDHPLDYATFEGTIPKGEYGGGTVMLWDEGTWEPDTDPDEGLDAGKLSFRLHGRRLEGAFALVRMKPRKGERSPRENWLLVKERDEWAADDAAAGDPVAAFDTSVATGRTMREIAHDGPPAAPAAARAGTARDRAANGGAAAGRDGLDGDGAGGKAPAFVAPQLATLVKAPPSGADWLHELKYDGYRIVCARGGADVRVFTRSGKDWTDRFPDIAAALARLPAGSFLLDGEAVALDEDGRSDFSRLQAAFDRGETIHAVLFDLLALEGQDRRDRPLRERKSALKRLLADAPAPLSYGDDIAGDGPEVLRRACALGAEGIVSKRASARYRSGRGRAWLKAKCVAEEEMAIGGFMPSSVRGKPFSSLLVGTFEGGRLVYHGRVGSGFDAATSERLASALRARARKTSPFGELPRDVRRRARFVRPDLLAVVRYQEMTPDGIVRHATFRGLREDKPAREASRIAERGGGPVAPPAADREVRAEGVRLTNPDRVLYPAAELTKQGLADYFAGIAPRMLPHVAGRPLSLVRCPEGRRKTCFFQKHHAKGMPEALHAVEIREASGGKEPYIALFDAAGLAACAQIGALELHVWGARVEAPDRPDRLVFDLDPDEDLAFADVVAGARDVRDLLSSVGLTSFPLLTGGKGIHVIVPLSGDDGWDRAKPFARAVATALARADPERYVAKAAKAARKGRIFVDWLRNARGATAIAPFSPRAKENATVATPVRWDELGRMSGAGAYTIASLPRRLAQLGSDPWAGFDDARARIDDDLLKAMEQTAARRR